MGGVDVGEGGGKKRATNSDINMIPFIDLLMCTIAFLLITAVWVICLTNAVNLIDGLDGLAAGVVAIGGGALALYGIRLMGLGLEISDIKQIARELFRFGRDKIGADQMGEIIAGTPGLSQFA